MFGSSGDGDEGIEVAEFAEKSGIVVKIKKFYFIFKLVFDKCGFAKCLGGKSILYQMILRHPYHNLINERYIRKNNYPLIHVFHLLVRYLFFVDLSHTY